MKIGINTLFLIPGKVGGTETYTRGLITGTEKIDKKNEYTIFCNKENYTTFSLNSENFKKILCPVLSTLRFQRILYEQLLFPFRIWRERIDVLLSTGYICPICLPCKSIVVIYDLNWFFHPEEFSPLARFFWKLLVTLSAKRSDLIITSSENSKKDISSVLNVKKNKIRVVYGGIDRKKFYLAKDKEIVSKIKDKYQIKNKLILTVSASYKFKNLTKLIEGFNTLLKKAQSLQLLIVGLGGKGKPEIEKQINEFNLDHKVLVAGWVPEEDLPLLYKAAEMYVHPSLYEGFGFPVLEAMACGCPVVSSKSASLPELVGNAGLQVDAKRPTEIRKQMERLLSDIKLRNELKKRGLTQADKFTWEKASSEMLSIFHQLSK